MIIPPALARNVVQAWPGEGERWLERLPALLAEVAADWKLVPGRSYGLTYHWVTAVTCEDGSAAVLKLGVPDGHLAPEAQALQIFDGQGAVRLFAQDAGRGALLMERAVPGRSVAALVPQDDEAATAALIGAGRGLHRAPPPACTLADLRAEGASFRVYLQRIPGDDPLPRHLVQQASRLFDELCASAPPSLLLHGDLHHDNVVQAERESWLAIDPKGLVGDPGYDCAAMLYNPEPWRREDDLLALVPARVEQLADGFGLPLDRVVAWGFVMGMLSEVWTANDGGPVGSRALDVATLLHPRLP